jgi:LysW-gamma-L-lysine carboxypeptidase
MVEKRGGKWAQYKFQSSYPVQEVSSERPVSEAEMPERRVLNASPLKVNAIDLLTDLVSISSPSGHEAKAATHLVGWLNAHGLTAYVDEVGNAVGVKGNGPQEILLLGHIDTFPGEAPVRREGDFLYGRGTVDAKGALCAFAVATTQVDVPDGWQITVVGAVEEKSATSKGARHILTQRLDNAPALQPPTYCIIGEPSHWDRVTLSYKGRLLMDVTMQVPFSHSTEAGKLPAEQAVGCWRQVEAFCADTNEARQAPTTFNQLDPSLRHIASHDEGAFGVVEMNLGFRLPVGISPLDLEQKLHQLAGKLPDGATVELQFYGEEGAYKGSQSSPLVRAFLQAIRTAGGYPRFVVKAGTADMNVVGPPWPNTPIVAYGPGDSNLDHTPDEHIDLNEYLRAIEVLQVMLEKLTSQV